MFTIHSKSYNAVVCLHKHNVKYLASTERVRLRYGRFLHEEGGGAVYHIVVVLTDFAPPPAPNRPIAAAKAPFLRKSPPISVDER